MKTLIRTTLYLAIFLASTLTYGQYNAGSGSGTTGGSHTFVGVSAGTSNTGGNNTFIGQAAGRFNTSGHNNTFLGRTAGYNNTIGRLNTFLGSYAGYNNTSGQHNSFIGHATGRFNTTGGYNVFIGRTAGYKNTTGNMNTFVGRSAGLGNTTGSYNSFFGESAGHSNTTGANNVFIGQFTGVNNETGADNTYLGYRAGNYARGSRNVFIGHKAGSYEESSDKLYIANSSTREPLIYGDFAAEEMTINGILRIKSPDGENSLGLFASDNGEWNNKIAFRTASTGEIRHIITDDYGSNNLVIHPGYGPSANSMVQVNGSMKIGLQSWVSTPGNYKLYVERGILTEKVKVASVGSADWADYVFEADYELNSIEEVEQFVKANKHLPNVPSAKQVEENGIDMVEMDATLLRQIEELWLHTITLNERIVELETQLNK